MIDFDFAARLRRWKPESAWHFITVPEEVSAAIRSFAPEAKRGFGSVQVRVKTGGSDWKTSVFPDKASGCFVLPVKKSVRQAEDLYDGDDVSVRLELIL